VFHKTYCQYCGKIVESSGHTCETPQPVPVGWKCPVCGYGNAPWASSCDNCIVVNSHKELLDHLSKRPADWLWRPDQITFTCEGKG